MNGNTKKEETINESTLSLSLKPTVLKKIVPHDETKSSINEIWDFLEDVTKDNKYSKSRESTLQNENELLVKKIETHGAGWLFGNLRELIAKKVYADVIYNTDELLSSKEGFLFAYNFDDDAKYQNCFPVDEYYGSTAKGNMMEYIRSFVALTKGTYAFSMNENVEEVRNGNHKDEHVLEIVVEEGDVIIWKDNMFSFIGLIQDGCDVTIRAGVYITMIPHNNATSMKKIPYKAKKQAYHTSQTTTPYPDLEQFTNGKQQDNDDLLCKNYFRYGPPQLTYRQAQLYGLIDYNNEKSQQELIKGALLSGIVFSNKEYYKYIPSTTENINDIVSWNDEDKNAFDLKWHKQQSAMFDNCAGNPIAECLYIDNEPIMGQDKYLGGVASPCGNYIYGVPGFAKQVLSIHVPTGYVEYIGPKYTGEFKWLRGVEVPPTSEYPCGLCIALPSNANTILKINPCTQKVTTFGNITSGEDNTWLYHGGGLHPKTNLIYAVPANASHVLVIDPINDKSWDIGPNFGNMKQKWYGGIYSKYDDCIYGIPHNETGILKINPNTNECTIFAQTLSKGLWKWHGGLITSDGKTIIGFPNNSNSILIIHIPEQSISFIDQYSNHVTTEENNQEQTLPILKSGRHRHPHNGKYKYLGGALSKNDKYCYLFPSDSERVLKINMNNFVMKTIGPLLVEGGGKYQNGFYSQRDDCIYGIPQNARSVVRIIPSSHDDVDDIVDMIYCGDNMVNYKDKFEGGVISQDGIIFCMPLRAKGVLKIIPSNICTNEDEGVDHDSDVAKKERELKLIEYQRKHEEKLNDKKKKDELKRLSPTEYMKQLTIEDSIDNNGTTTKTILKYSKFDEITGLPTHCYSGKPLNKSQGKRAKKEWSSQLKKFEKEMNKLNQQ